MQHVDHLSRRLVHPGRRLQAQQALLVQLQSRLMSATARDFERRQWQVRRLVERGCRALPNIDAQQSHVNALMRRVTAASERRLSTTVARLESLGRALAHLDPHAVLARGYSIVTDERGGVVREAARLVQGEALTIGFARGSALVRVEDKRDE
jgi:exodeoxyribonuclease VII large subunit